MRDMITRPSAYVLIGLLALPSPAPGAELRQEALRGFGQYAQRTEERIAGEVRNDKTFLWVEGLPPEQQRQAMKQLRRGEVVIERMRTRPAGAAISTPGAMIHHWMGTLLISGATLAQVLRTIQDYDRHQEYFRPEVVRSQTLQHDGDDFRIYLRLKRTKIVTAVLDTEHQVRYHRLDATHAYSDSHSTHIAEIADPGETDERALPLQDDHGFLWRLNSYWRFLETREGVYVQCEALSLTRDVPAGLGWLVRPFIESIPKESLDFTLRSTRAAVSDAPQWRAHKEE
jgi:hypothetical protein